MARTSANRNVVTERGRENPNERAFVVRFEPIGSMRGLFRGRVELVASGEALRFRSLKQLLGFMTNALRRHAVPEETKGGASPCHIDRS